MNTEAITGLSARQLAGLVAAIREDQGEYSATGRGCYLDLHDSVMLVV